MARGKFISFEGGEGTGKSTQIRRLADRLEAAGIAVVETREPGGTPGAEIIRRTILSGRTRNLGPFAEALMMNAARDDHLNEVIRPALKAGKWVLCDRFADSTRVYQGTMGDTDSDLLKAMEQAVVAKDWPNLTIILDLDPEIGLERARAVTRKALGQSAPADRFEDEALDEHHRMRLAFLEIARAEPDRCAVIDADQSPDAVAEAVWSAVTTRLKLPRKKARADTAD